jgi:chaperonin GroES
MSSPLRPLADYVVAQAEEVQTKTASGLLLPEKSGEKPQTAKVVAVGSEVKNVKVGDRIVYKGYSNTDVKVGDSDYILVKEEDILATVK